MAVLTATACSAEPNLTVDGASRFQSIDGMGVNLNVNEWNGGRLKAAIDQLLATNGSSLFRVCRDPMDWVSDEAQITPLRELNSAVLRQVYEAPRMQDIWNTIAYLNEKGIRGEQIVLCFMGWTPAWLGGSGAFNQVSHIAPGKEADFATMVASLVRYGKLDRKLDFGLVSPLNESDWNCLEGPCVEPAQARAVLRTLAEELTRMDVGNVRFVGVDTANSPASYVSEILADPVVAEQTAHLSFHIYDKSASPDPTAGKTFWLTETSAWCPGCDAGVSSADDEWAFAKMTTDIVLGDLRNGMAATLIWEAYDSFWFHHDASSYWGLLSRDANGLFKPRKRFFANAQINHFVSPGDVVLDAANNLPELGTTVAVYNPGSGKIALIGRNSANIPVEIQGQLNNLPPNFPTVESLAMYVTTATDNLLRVGDVPVSGGAFSVTVPADGIFSLSNQPFALDTSPPTIKVAVPASGSDVSGHITLSADSSDDSGLAGLQWLVDGEPHGPESLTAPYSTDLDTGTLPPGLHRLAAIGRDQAGNMGISEVVEINVKPSAIIAPAPTPIPIPEPTPAPGSTPEPTSPPSSNSARIPADPAPGRSRFSLAILKAGSGTGTVSGSSAGLKCGPTCGITLDAGKRLSLTAKPGRDSRFAGWSGACAGTGKCRLEFSRELSATAHFSVRTFPLAITVRGPGAVRSVNVSGIDCGGDCDEAYPLGSRVTLSAQAPEGSEFGGWKGSCASAGRKPLCTVTVNRRRSATAVFR